jgi:hypothetical protein
MQEHELGVGEELVIEGGIRLSILAVEADEVLLGLTGLETSDVAGPLVVTGCLPAARQPAPESAVGGR